MRSVKNIKLAFALLFIITMVLDGCSDSFLQPDPKSFRTPEKTLINRPGFEAVLLQSRRILAREYYGSNTMLQTEFMFTDISQNTGHRAKHIHNLDRQMTPTTEGTGDGASRTRDYWNTAYDGINYANIVLTNLDNEGINWKEGREKKIVRGEALFHRSYWYYRLVNQFGDVPLVLKEVNEPKLDFYTFSREAILKKIRNDMEFAVQWLPKRAVAGKENAAAGYYLLSKIYLELRQFQEAVDATSQVIDGGRFSLMINRFGSGKYADDPRFNVLWDLHEKENIGNANNTEGILVVTDQKATEGNFEDGTNRMRDFEPRWSWGPVKDPNGMNGTTAGPEGNPFSDSLGRGIARIGGSPYYNYTIWQDSSDLRHSDVNWFSKDEFIYNNPESEYYGQPFVKGFVGDTTRTWFPFPYYIIYVPDEVHSPKIGGHSNWYIYRVAGLYLLRAEAYYWMGNLSKAAADINQVRKRAHASPVRADDVTIDYIFDERARELYLEAPRKTEMTRVSYIMAQLGRKGYNFENMYQKNWYYDRVISANVYYQQELTYGANTYKISPYHVYWPIPQNEIDANQFGHINQNEGYPGAENNISPKTLSDTVKVE